MQPSRPPPPPPAQRTPARRAGLAVKRALDVTVAALSLLVLSPVILVVALLLLATSGRPVLFRHRRLGRDGRPFTLLKFRTMRGQPPAWDRPLDDEQRITPAGRVLRALSLDELPELWNVLRGDLSLVGPRPLLPEYRDLYSRDQWRRHAVRPGMAGPVLAMGRNALSWEDKFAWDVWYVDNWSLWLDFKVFWLSVWRALRREGVAAEGHATMPRFEGARTEKAE